MSSQRHTLSNPMAITATRFGCVLVTAGLLWASPVLAQSTFDGTTYDNRPDATATDGYYIPGMPLPEDSEKDAAAQDSKKGESAKGKGSRANRISKITKVERGSALEDATQVRTLKVGDIYQGIVPGINNWHLFARKARDAARANPNRGNRLTWIGFQPFEKGSRIFAQTIKPATYSVNEVSMEDGSYEVRVSLLGTRVPVRNNRRALDTSYFRSAVIGAEAFRSGSDTLLVIRLQKKVPFQLQQDAEFLYISFDDAGSSSFADEEKARESEKSNSNKDGGQYDQNGNGKKSGSGSKSGGSGAAVPD